jgi:hypothetical protein
MLIPLISQELDHLLAHYKLYAIPLATDDAKSQKRGAFGDLFHQGPYLSTASLLLSVSSVESRAMTGVLVSQMRSLNDCA